MALGVNQHGVPIRLELLGHAHTQGTLHRVYASSVTTAATAVSRTAVTALGQAVLDCDVFDGNCAGLNKEDAVGVGPVHDVAVADDRDVLVDQGQGVGQGDVCREGDGVAVSGTGDGVSEFSISGDVKVGCMGHAQRVEQKAGKQNRYQGGQGNGKARMFFHLSLFVKWIRAILLSSFHGRWVTPDRRGGHLSGAGKAQFKEIYHG